MIICDRRQTILDEDGHLLIVGGPGSGKTTIALQKATKIIAAGLQPGQSILFLSFSRAARGKGRRGVESARSIRPYVRSLASRPSIPSAGHCSKAMATCSALRKESSRSCYLKMKRLCPVE
ncbi:UvrD-helicase domain-containing protein [Pseudomonas aeruginosa]